MIRFTQIEIQNFVVFEHVVVEPSLDSEKPLTVIRAENASGKTTFLRAVRWGMYGEKGLPGENSTFGVHPAFWEPTPEGLETRVAIDFTNDGSTRHDTSTGDTGNDTKYRLVRTVTTVASDQDPGYQRIKAQAQLMIQTPGGGWEPNSNGVDHVIEQLLPWELRDFFVMDADEAAEFVGGSEAVTISRSEVEAKTTYAIKALLGLEVFKQAAKRVAEAQATFGAKATKAIGDADLDVMQTEKDETRRQIDDLEQKLEDSQRKLNDLQDLHAGKNELLREQLKGEGALEELEKRHTNNQRALERAGKDQKTELAELRSNLGSLSLYASAARKQVSAAFEYLAPMHESGEIPQRHLGYVQKVLESGTCICGQNIADPGTRRSHVEQQLARSADQAAHADYLGSIYYAALALKQSASSADWQSDADAAQARLAEADQQWSNLKTERADIDDKLQAVNSSDIALTQESISALQSQIEGVKPLISEYTNRLPQLRGELDSLGKQIHARLNRENAAKAHRRAEDLAGTIYKILTNAYETIQNDQVSELSDEMNRLFSSMVDNVPDADGSNGEAGKETIRTIERIGVRPVASDRFEIFAINNHGRDKPHIEINGASRRVIALAFVLALCSESKTRAPLVADSLLNMMSGAVRRNTLAATAAKSGQPILLLTGDDLGDSEAAIVAERSGATYTLTGQWHGSVMNQTDPRAISLICECGPRNFCDICERQGQANNQPGWSKRQDY